MTIDEIADYCEFLDCKVSAGHPEHGFVHIDGTGIQDRTYTYNRMQMLHEISRLPSPTKALAHADTFKITREGQTRTLDREAFDKELSEFQRKVGIA